MIFFCFNQTKNVELVYFHQTKEYDFFLFHQANTEKLVYFHQTKECESTKQKNVIFSASTKQKMWN